MSIVASHARTPAESLRPSKSRAQAVEAYFDSAAVAADLALAHRDATGTDDFRKAAVERFRQELEGGRARARADLENRGSGLACVEQLAAIEDALIRAIYDYVIAYIYPAENPSLGERICIAAVGGYGRGGLAPGSDIDLLFLLPYKQTAWSESVTEAVLYVLWDLRQKVGHSTRSVEECLRQARADMTVRTALLEARFLLGDVALFEELRARFDKEIVRGTASEFVAAKLAERERRVSRAGSSRYLVEPNVKEGKGGLRDLNTLFWIAKYVYRVSDAAELVAAGLFTDAEFKLFRRCEEFLWKVRCHLHYVTGRSEERLSFDLQRAIASRLGYVGHSGLSDVERFMKHYFLIAKAVGDLTAIVCAAMEERQAKPRAMLNRFVGKFKRRGKLLSIAGFRRRNQSHHGRGRRRCSNAIRST
jgi:[protein-PII] uridylyltransferase